MKLLNYFMRPDMQAAYANFLPGNSPIAKASYPMLNDKARAMAPDMNSAQTTSVNVE
jgi:hypothetical protein